MHSDQQFPLGEAFPPSAYLMRSNAPIAPTLGATLPLGIRHLRPFRGVQLQPTEVCPKNFIIFDQTDNKSRVMFHPALTHKFSCPGVNIHASFVEDNILEREDAESEKRESSSPLKEDTRDIDALLSFEEEEDDDDEEVSTARTHGSYGSSSPDSCSSYGPKRSKLKLSSIRKSLSDCSKSSNNERKLQRMKKMVKALRGIVPGADRMNTSAVLDEAVRYLKSLKVELKKLGITNLRN